MTVKTANSQPNSQETDGEHDRADHHAGKTSLGRCRLARLGALAALDLVVLGLPREDGEEGQHHPDAKGTKACKGQPRWKEVKNEERTYMMGMKANPTEPRGNPWISPKTIGTAAREKIRSA